MNRARHGARAISPEQRRAIFALYRELGIGDDLRHNVQYGVAKKASLTDFTSNDAGRLIEHLQRLAAQAARPAPGGTGTPARARTRVSAPPNRNIHKLPSPDQIAVLDHLYRFAGYATIEAQRTFASHIEKHPRPRSMWEAEELIFALIAQCAPTMLSTISAEEFAGRLTPFEYAFMYTNTVKYYFDGTLNKDTYNNAHYELTTYVEKRNQRGRRTMPRFSMTKFFEILEKYNG